MPRAGTPRKPGVQPRYVSGLPPLKGTTRLTPQQVRFVECYAKTGDKKNSAITAGYSPIRASERAAECLKNPTVQQYLQSLRSESRAIAAYDVAVAMQEALDVIAFAKLKGNAMAYCKAVELRAKLSGLLVDRVEVISVDLTGALQAARLRVFPPASIQLTQAEIQAQPEPIG